MKTKTAPRTATPEALAKYGTTIHNCNCPDRVNRGGSHIDPIQQDSVCYHMLTKRQQVRAGQAAPAKAPLVGSWKTIDGIQVYTLDEAPAAPAQAAPAAKTAESLNALRSRRADLEARLEEVSYQIDMCQPVDEIEAADFDYFQLGYMMNDMDCIMGELEDLDRKIARAIQAEDMAGKPKPKATPATVVTCASHSGLKMSATESLLAAISPQLQGSPIRRHG